MGEELLPLGRRTSTPHVHTCPRLLLVKLSSFSFHVDPVLPPSLPFTLRQRVRTHNSLLRPSFWIFVLFFDSPISFCLSPVFSFPLHYSYKGEGRKVRTNPWWVGVTKFRQEASFKLRNRGHFLENSVTDEEQKSPTNCGETIVKSKVMYTGGPTLEKLQRGEGPV